MIAHQGQVGPVRQIKQWQARGVLALMLEAMLDAIKMGTAIGESLLYRLLNLKSRILLV